MSTKNRYQLLGILILGSAAMVFLAGALSSLTLLPAETTALFRETHAPDFVLDLGWLFSVIVILFALGIILLTPIGLWRRLLYAAAGLLGVAVLIMLVIGLAGDTPIEMPSVSTGLQITPTAELVEIVLTLEQEAAPEEGAFVPPSRWIGMVITVGMGILLVALALVIAWRMRRPPESKLSPLLRLAQEAQLALDSLLGGGDVRDVVVRCYFEMGQVLDRTQGLRRAEAVTPREFAAQLTALGLPLDPVVTLTGLFEEARYGMHVTDRAAAQRAITCLTAIITVCQANA